MLASGILLLNHLWLKEEDSKSGALRETSEEKWRRGSRERREEEGEGGGEEGRGRGERGKMREGRRKDRERKRRERGRREEKGEDGELT